MVIRLVCGFQLFHLIKKPFITSIKPENLASDGSLLTKLLFFIPNSFLTSSKSGISKLEPSPAIKKNLLNVLNNELLACN